MEGTKSTHDRLQDTHQYTLYFPAHQSVFFFSSYHSCRPLCSQWPLSPLSSFVSPTYLPSSYIVVLSHPSHVEILTIPTPVGHRQSTAWTPVIERFIGVKCQLNFSNLCRCLAILYPVGIEYILCVAPVMSASGRDNRSVL